MVTSINQIARVIHLGATRESSTRVTLLIGDQETEIDWETPLPSLGDLFLVKADDALQVVKKIGSSEDGSLRTDGDAMRWRRPTHGGKTRMQILHLRHRIRRAVRAYLEEEGFIEIDPPLLVHGTTPDGSIQSFKIDDRYLTTSTEHQIKRLEVGGFERLFTLTKNFRKADGEGSTHNPEFTMLEWDRVRGTLADVERDAENLVRRAQQALGGGDTLIYQGHSVTLTPPWPRLTVREIIHRITGVELADFRLEAVCTAVAAAGIAIHDAWKDDRDFLFSLLMEHLQNHIGFDKPTFVQDWPAFMTSMAPAKGLGGGDASAQSSVSPRSELYICGLELCNGFPSVTAPREQSRGFDEQLERRIREGKEPIEIDHRLLAAQREGLPPCTGMAMGFDRLVMILTDQAEIRHTLAFAWDEV